MFFGVKKCFFGVKKCFWRQNAFFAVKQCSAFFEYHKFSKINYAEFLNLKKRQIVTEISRDVTKSSRTRLSVSWAMLFNVILTPIITAAIYRSEFVESRDGHLAI